MISGYNSCDNDAEVFKATGLKNSYNRMKQYNLSTIFFSEWKLKLNRDEYSKLVDILKLYNTNKINKDIMFMKIKEAFKNFDKLINDFRLIFMK